MKKWLIKQRKNNLNKLMKLCKKTFCSLDNLEKTTHTAKEAIKNQDLNQLALVVKEIKGLKSALGSLKNQLYTDTLTNLYNRKWLMEHLLDDGTFKNEGILIFIDIDNFKPINDIYGHVIGDKVLQYFASFFKVNLKKMDVVRYAGDEFVAISNNPKMEESFIKMKKIQEDLLSKKLKLSNGEPLCLTFSFGLTRFEKGSNFRDVLEIADSLMYKSKKQKGSQRGR
ncbi:MAG TPA: GGDEF domain-containing protein [Sulfurimonas sp.]|nr:GGDEF domain-containing protein [Sulfurimonas sp.]